MGEFEGNRLEVAAFVRGALLELSQNGCDVAVLHGWENSFEEDLSDVDFVVDRRTFASLAGLVSRYCEGVGWRLMQVLKHENTGCFYVCSRAENPECVVALDACSDYQRRGIHFLRAQELLDGKQSLGWGGFRLKSETELKYRLVKAAAKEKVSGEIYREYKTYSEEDRRSAIIWVRNQWDVRMSSEDRTSFGEFYEKLVNKFSAPSMLARISSMPRYLGRVIWPTGALVRVSPDLSEDELKRFLNCYSHNYFRATESVEDFRVIDCKKIIKSGLVCHRGKSRWWQRVFLRDSYFDGSGCRTEAALITSFGLWLAERVCLREKLG